MLGVTDIADKSLTARHSRRFLIGQKKNFTFEIRKKLNSAHFVIGNVLNLIIQ